MTIRVLICTSASLLAACVPEPLPIEIGHDHGSTPGAAEVEPIPEPEDEFVPVPGVDTAIPAEPPDLLEVRQRGTWLQIAARVPQERTLRIGQRTITVPEGTWQALFALDWMDACNIADTVDVELGREGWTIDLHGEVSYGDWRPVLSVDPSRPPQNQYDPIVACSSLNGQHWYPSEDHDRVISVSWDASLGELDVQWDDPTGQPWHIGTGFAWSTIPADTTGPLRVVNPNRWVVQRSVWRSPAPIAVQ